MRVLRYGGFLFLPMFEIPFEVIDAGAGVVEIRISPCSRRMKHLKCRQVDSEDISR